MNSSSPLAVAAMETARAVAERFPLLGAAWQESQELTRRACIAAPTVFDYVLSSALIQLLAMTVLTLVSLKVVTSVLTVLAKHGIKNSLYLMGIKLVKAIPFARSIIDKEQAKLRVKIRKQLLGQVDQGERHLELPAKPVPAGELLKTLEGWKAVEDKNWKSGKVSGAVYLGEDSIKETVNKAYALFSLANPLHPDIFPYVRKMEAEVVRMTLALFNGSETSCGAMTSGGTESILMAMKAYREMARERGVTEPELIIPVSAHAAFLKACHYFCIKPVMVPIDLNTFQVKLSAVRRAINGNTIALVGSAPGFPHGVIDPIKELAQLARSYRVGLHVDCCLGSFLLPLCSELGYDIAPFDFRVPGVTSISCDPHKYGFTPKGSSVIMYADPSIRQYQYFVAPDWTGGIYASPSIAGSRSGGVIAGAWTTMMLLGREGYLRIVKDIMTTRDNILHAIAEMPEIQICGRPESSVIAFMSRNEKRLDVYKVQEAMTNRHWHLNALQYPRSVHLCITKLQVDKWQTFVSDLKESIAHVLANPDKYKDGTAAVYGMAESVPDRSLVSDMTAIYLDTLYEV